MSIGLPEKAEQKTEQVLVRLTKKEKRRLERIAEEIEQAQGVIGRHALLALMEGYDEGRTAPTPVKKKRSKK